MIEVKQTAVSNQCSGYASAWIQTTVTRQPAVSKNLLTYTSIESYYSKDIIAAN